MVTIQKYVFPLLLKTAVIKIKNSPISSTILSMPDIGLYAYCISNFILFLNIRNLPVNRRFSLHYPTFVQEMKNRSLQQA